MLRYSLLLVLLCLYNQTSFAFNEVQHQNLTTSITDLRETATSPDSNSTLIGRWRDGVSLAVDVNGDFGVFGNGASVEVLNLSDPTNPISLTNCSFF